MGTAVTFPGPWPQPRPRVMPDHQFFHLDPAETDRAGVLRKATDLCLAGSLRLAGLCQRELHKPVPSRGLCRGPGGGA